jgi:hypothetical protein
VSRTKRAPGPPRGLYLGPDPNDPDPVFALRGRANLALRVTGDKVRWRCPYCGARAKKKLRPGRVAGIRLRHEDWCAVPLNAELEARR